MAKSPKVNGRPAYESSELTKRICRDIWGHVGLRAKARKLCFITTNIRDIWIYIGIRFRDITPTVENQMYNKRESNMEAGVI